MPQEECPRLALIKQDLEAALEKNRFLEKENEQLKQELAFIKAQARQKPSVVKRLQVTNSTTMTNESQHDQNESMGTNLQEDTHHACSRPSSPDLILFKNRSPRTPTPPPKPTVHTKILSPSVVNGSKAPPPPPLPPLKLRGGAMSAVRRVPEVVELYRLLMRKDARTTDVRTSNTGVAAMADPKNMIGEIENRSTYLLAIKSDVETQGEFISFLAKEVENAAYTEISDVEAFVKWLDGELSDLIDERAVLKHFPQWPERKADAMREAACSYRDLKNLDTEVSSFLYNPQLPAAMALKRTQALQDKLERSIQNIGRTRENASKKYKEFQIPCSWMLETGITGQLKLCSMRLAEYYIKQITLQLQQSTADQENLILQGVRFAYRVHQFIGGFNAETKEAFQKMTEASGMCSLVDNHE